MKIIRKWFENNSDDYDIDEYDGHLEAKTIYALFMIVEPHPGTKNRWMLRVTALASFDRWANSTAVEEFFKTDVELCEYLSSHQLDIYKAMLGFLSEDYSGLHEAFNKMRLERKGY